MAGSTALVLGAPNRFFSLRMAAIDDSKPLGTYLVRESRCNSNQGLICTGDMIPSLPATCVKKRALPADYDRPTAINLYKWAKRMLRMGAQVCIAFASMYVAARVGRGYSRSECETDGAVSISSLQATCGGTQNLEGAQGRRPSDQSPQGSSRAEIQAGVNMIVKTLWNPELWGPYHPMDVRDTFDELCCRWDNYSSQLSAFQRNRTGPRWVQAALYLVPNRRITTLSIELTSF